MTSPAPRRQELLRKYFPSTIRLIDLMFGLKGAFAYLRDFAAPISIHPHDIPTEVPLDRIPHVIFTKDGLTIGSVAGHHGDAPAVIYRIDYARKGITFSVDIDAKGLSGLRSIAAGSDLLVFNTAVLDPPGSPAILYTLHTPPRDIGELAREAGVRRVLLSHISPAVEANQDKVLESIKRRYQGPLSLAADRTSVAP